MAIDLMTLSEALQPYVLRWIRDRASRVRAVQSVNTAQSIPNATLTIVQYDTEVYDQLGEYNPATYTFTAKAAGVYLVEAAVIFDATGAFTGEESASLRLYKGATLYSYLDRRDQLNVATSTLTYVRLGGSDTIHLAAGETILVRVYQTSGGALALAGSAEHNRLAIHRLS